MLVYFFSDLFTYYEVKKWLTEFLGYQWESQM